MDPSPVPSTSLDGSFFIQVRFLLPLAAWWRKFKFWVSLQQICHCNILTKSGAKLVQQFSHIWYFNFTSKQITLCGSTLSAGNSVLEILVHLKWRGVKQTVTRIGSTIPVTHGSGTFRWCLWNIGRGSRKVRKKMRIQCFYGFTVHQ